MHNPGARRTVGQSVLSAAKVLDTKRVKVRLAAFAKAHSAYVKAADKVLAAESVRDAAHAAVAEHDVAQDAALDALVLALVVAGAPRLSPLKGLSNVAPADLKKLAAPKQARELLRATEAITKRGGLSPALKRATKAAHDAATAVLKASVAVAPREKLYQESLAARDALGLPWETALAYLKRAARVAEDDGATGLYGALFTSAAPAPAKKKPAQKKQPAVA